MGKMIRLLKTLFGFKTESNSGDRRTNIPSCSSRSRHQYATNSPPETPLVTRIHKNHCEDQTKRAIALAAATAAAADIAVAAAQAAYAFARLTTQIQAGTNGDRENSAAVTIQSLFRGYLSRKALRALKSLVKLQALVRGYLVRKRAVQTLQGMEALFRARSSVCAHKIRLQDSEYHPRRSMREASEGRSRRISTSLQIPNDGGPSPVKMDLKEPKWKLRRANTWAWAADQTPSPLLTNPRHLSIPGSSNFHEFESFFSTTHNTPRSAYSCGPEDLESIYDGLSKDDSFASHPGYMANTKSFRAKVRSRSAPKQRPEYGLGVKKSDGLTEVECGLEIMRSRSKSKSPSMLKNTFKNYVMDWKVFKKST